MVDGLECPYRTMTVEEQQRIRVRNQKRLAWASDSIGKDTLRFKHREPKYFGGGRSCLICGRTVYNCYVLESSSKVEVYAGKECLMTIFAYRDGAFADVNGNTD